MVDVTLRAGNTVDLARLQRHFYAASSCGVCGKASICAVRVHGIQRPAEDMRISPALLAGLPAVLRNRQTVFDRTGGLHAAALFDGSGALLDVREDVGRHNAVDKVIGRALLDRRLPLSQQILFVSGRGAFEIVQKALVAGVPVVASVSAPSSLAVELAREYGLTLIGFIRGQRFVVYSGHERLAHAIRGRLHHTEACDIDFNPAVSLGVFSDVDVCDEKGAQLRASTRIMRQALGHTSCRGQCVGVE